MNNYFVENNPNACCLCGSTEKLTGEHKFKASILKEEFGKKKLFLGDFGNAHPPRLAQSTKSKIFCFTSTLCASCNNTRTQPADIEFDIFHKKTMELLHQGSAPGCVFNDVRYTYNSEPYLNIFRYFAKLLCCHLAEINAPRPIQVAQFAMGEIDENPVILRMGEDWTYKQARSMGINKFGFRSNATLFNKTKTRVQGFYSALSFGPIQYRFSIEMTLNTMEILNTEYPDFCYRHLSQSSSAMSHEDKLRLGLVEK